jgi:putative tryptophan/tyrosine transport system substrate-binding protein
MRRRKFILALAAALLTGGMVVPVSAQTTKIARVGILIFGRAAPTPLWNECIERLRLLGWERGRNLIIEPRYTGGRPELFAAGAAELVALSPDVIVAPSSQAVEAVLAKTSSIPIVMLNVSHPVEAGFIKSLASSGSNVTGFTNQAKDSEYKALELLREVSPGIDRVGVLYSPSNAGSALAVKQLLATSPSALGFSVVPVPIDRPADIHTAFDHRPGRAACRRRSPDASDHHERGADRSLPDRSSNADGHRTQ